jgi:hypothetical protein
VIQMPGKRIVYAVQLNVDLPLSTGKDEKPAVEPAPKPVSVPDGHKSIGKVVFDIDFGLISTWPAQLPSKEITLENPSGLPVLGTASCRLGWLEIKPDRFTIPGKGQVRIMIGMAEGVRNLPADDYHAEDAIIIDVGGRKTWINVKLKVEKLPEIPVGPTIEFGKVWQAADKYPRHELSIANPLIWEQEVKARVTQDWLTVEPEVLNCPGKQACKVTVTLNKGVLKLPPGFKVAARAVLLTCGKQTQEYHVTLELVDQPVEQPKAPETPQPVQPELPKVEGKASPEAKPDGLITLQEQKQPYILDFGEVTDWAPSHTSRSFRLTNSTSKPLDGKAAVNDLPWLKVEPEQFRINPGSYQDIKVQLTEEARGKFRKFNAENAITVDYQGKQLSIQVTARIRPQSSVPVGVVSAVAVPREEQKVQAVVSTKKPAENLFALDLSKDLDPNSEVKNILNFGTIKTWSGEIAGREIIMGNSSNKVIKGSITTEVAWLDVTPAQFECPPGGQVTLKINLSQDARTMPPRPRAYRAEDAICISTDERKYCLLASVIIQTSG